ncbi:MAG TPA: hypothetical protein VLJ88_19680 [Propionibacteriaceae bacterium]|nr:hypothetical protein [Propionibacteriaceae bacterium]
MIALSDLYGQPQLVARPTNDLQGRAVRRGLHRPSRMARTVVHSATAVLVLPEIASDYSVGASKQTLRRKVRKAQTLGIYWVEVVDPVERLHLIQLANEQERHHVQEEYRREDPDNDFLLAYPLWLVAYTADHRPVLLSVTPFDGEWATLTYFRTIGAGEEQSNARFLMTQVVVERLVERGVRYLADVSSPAHLSNGWRHFQRMLGFRIARVSLQDEVSILASAASPVTQHREPPRLPQRSAPS